MHALKAVINDMAQFSVDHVIVPGDVINIGPNSAAVVAHIARSGWAVIRGNNEYYLLDSGTDRAPEKWRNYTLIPWLHQQVGRHWHTVIAGWPDTLSLRYPDAPTVRVAHGSPRSPWEPIFPATPDEEVSAMLYGLQDPVLIAGHTHLPLERRVGNWHIINPGSVGQAADGQPGACYAILDGSPAGWTVTFRRVDYDYAPLFDDLERSGILEVPGVAGELIRRELETARLHLYPFAQWRAAQHPNEPESRALLDQFSDEVRWAYTPKPYHIGREVPVKA